MADSHRGTIVADCNIEPQLFTCHAAKNRENYVRVHAFAPAHAQRLASAWLGVPPRDVCVARTEPQLLSLAVA